VAGSARQVRGCARRRQSGSPLCSSVMSWQQQQQTQQRTVAAVEYPCTHLVRILQPQRARVV
jgi:hypothetical protein